MALWVLRGRHLSSSLSYYFVGVTLFHMMILWAGEGGLTQYNSLKALHSVRLTNVCSRELTGSGGSSTVRKTEKNIPQLSSQQYPGNVTGLSFTPVRMYCVYRIVRKGPCKTLLFTSVHTTANHLLFSSPFLDYLDAKGVHIQAPQLNLPGYLCLTQDWYYVGGPYDRPEKLSRSRHIPQVCNALAWHYLVISISLVSTIMNKGEPAYTGGAYLRPRKPDLHSFWNTPSSGETGQTSNATRVLNRGLFPGIVRIKKN